MDSLDIVGITVWAVCAVVSLGLFVLPLVISPRRQPNTTTNAEKAD